MKFKLTALIALIVVLPVFVLSLRGKDALQGITWGLSPSKLGLCSLELSALKPICQSDKKDLTVNFGVYDPEGTFSGSNLFAIDHYFLKWNDFAAPNLQQDLQLSAVHNRWPLVTVEPWPFEDGVHTRQSLFEDIEASVYDSKIDSICLTFKSYQKPVLVRWGQEMEYVSGRFPWASADFSGYINSYQHFVTRCRSEASNTFYIWSPAGNKELLSYWPGKQYADYIGLSVFSLPQYDKDNYGKIRSFDEVFSEKYERVVNYGRPVIISELGVAGGKDHQWFWMQNAFQSFSKYPLLKSVIYFNAKDSKGAWGEKYQIPDWHIDAGVFNLKY